MIRRILSLIFSGILILASGFSSAQTTGIEQNLEFLTPSTGGKFLNWYGTADRSYFLQISEPSDPLKSWFWAAFIEAGNDEDISIEVDGTAQKGFFRLHYTDQLPGSGENLETADFDYDGFSNLHEITLRPRPGGIVGFPALSPSIQTNPLDADTDHDGLSDKWEEDNGLDPTDNGTRVVNNGPTGDPDLDGLCNLHEQSAGTNPNSPDTDGDGISDLGEIALGTNPKQADSDGDHINDSEDAGPTHVAIDWRKTAGPHFAVIELGITDSENLLFNDLSERGTVLFTKNFQQSPNLLTVIDNAQQSHELSTMPPDLVSPLGYFGAVQSTLIGDSVLGTRVIPPAPGTSEDCTWDPASDTYTPHEVLWYIDDVLDDRSEFRVERSYNIIQVAGEPTLDEVLLTTHGALDGSDWFDFGHAKIEQNGNIVSSFGYWKFNVGTAVYGALQELPEQSVTNSATLLQIDRSVLSGSAFQPRSQDSWHFTAGIDGLLVSKNNGDFIETGLTYESGESPVAVTSQGWLATTHKIWVNGKWIPLTDVVSGPKPQEVTLLGMLDTGMGVARLTFAGSSSTKIVLLAPMEVRGYATGEILVGIGSRGGTNLSEPERHLINTTSDYLGYHTVALSELKIAQWDDVMDHLGGGWYFKEEDFKLDKDAFHIRLPNLPPPSGTAEHRVKIWTEDGTGAVFDSGAEADLNIRPDFHETAAFCLVTDDATDDQAVIESKTDGGLGDRTYRAKLGGKVKIQWLTAPGPAPKPIFEISVPIKKTVTLKGYILKTAGGNDAVVRTVAPAYFERARKIMTSVGVDLKYDIAPAAANPSGVEFGGGNGGDFEIPFATEISGIEVLQASPEIRALMGAPGFRPSSPDVIPVYFARAFDSANHAGITTVASLMDAADAAYANAIFLNADHISESTLAHELLHVVLDGAHDGDDALWFQDHTNKHPWCLWAYSPGIPVLETSILARRRILDSMRSRLLKSSFCK